MADDSLLANYTVLNLLVMANTKVHTCNANMIPGFFSMDIYHYLIFVQHVTTAFGETLQIRLHILDIITASLQTELPGTPSIVVTDSL